MAFWGTATRLSFFPSVHDAKGLLKNIDPISLGRGGSKPLDILSVTLLLIFAWLGKHNNYIS